MNFDDILLKLGVSSEGILPKKSFSRDNKPPQKCLLLTSRFIGPKRSSSIQEDFPFDPNITDRQYAMPMTELCDWEISRCKKLIEYYEKQKEIVPELAAANKTAIYNSKSFERRKHFFYCYLSAVLNAPREIAFAEIDKINCLRKLWRNRAFEKDADEITISDKCCKFGSCPLIAIHGTDYCGWHILNDPKQKLFEKCPICNFPRIIKDALPCQGHRASSATRSSTKQIRNFSPASFKPQMPVPHPRHSMDEVKVRTEATIDDDVKNFINYLNIADPKILEEAGTLFRKMRMDSASEQEKTRLVHIVSQASTK